MRVVSVNVGRPVPLRVAGEMVPTAIGKQPVPGPVAVGRTSLAGDEQGDRLAELEPARPDILGKLAGWVDERGRSRAARGAA